MSTNTLYQIGTNAQIDDDVTLGYVYREDCEPLQIGDHAIIRCGSIIYANTQIGHRFQCGHQVLIRGEITIGNRCVIHHRCTLEGRLRIGSGVKIMAHCYLPSTTEIGDMVFIGPGTTFLNDKYPMRRTAPVCGPRVEDNVSIGGNVTVCPEVTIGQNSVVGAGALVNRDVPPNTLAYGVPARHHPLPADIADGNLPELMLPQTDLLGAQYDETWRDENLF